jgi:hypothetical protein
MQLIVDSLPCVSLNPNIVFQYIQLISMFVYFLIEHVAGEMV